MENQDNLKSKSTFSKVDSSKARKVEFLSNVARHVLFQVTSWIK